MKADLYQTETEAILIDGGLSMEDGFDGGVIIRIKIQPISLLLYIPWLEFKKDTCRC